MPTLYFQATTMQLIAALVGLRTQRTGYLWLSATCHVKKNPPDWFCRLSWNGERGMVTFERCQTRFPAEPKQSMRLLGQLRQSSAWVRSRMGIGVQILRGTGGLVGPRSTVQNLP